MTTGKQSVQQVLEAMAARHPHSYLFLTISGAHLYGFPSPDSDYDLRGVHILPLPEVVGLKLGPDTVTTTDFIDGIEVDFVTHEAKKFFNLLLKRNGYVLEQLYSPLVVHGAPEHAELKAIAEGCITRQHVHHYLGFAKNEWRLFQRETPPRVKPLLYIFRVLLTGIHLMRTGRIEANLAILNEDFGLSYLDEFIRIKREGSENVTIDGQTLEFIAKEYERLRNLLETSSTKSSLPDEPSALPALHDLLIRLRLADRGRFISKC